MKPVVCTVHCDEDMVPCKVVCSACGRTTAYLDEREDEIECVHCGATIDIPNKPTVEPT
jgi:DNA-directed RNA polymerase subunit RPC12/RpoP